MEHTGEYIIEGILVDKIKRHNVLYSTLENKIIEFEELKTALIRANKILSRLNRAYQKAGDLDSVDVGLLMKVAEALDYENNVYKFYKSIVNLASRNPEKYLGPVKDILSNRYVEC